MTIMRRRREAKPDPVNGRTKNRPRACQLRAWSWLWWLSFLWRGKFGNDVFNGPILLSIAWTVRGAGGVALLLPQL